MRRAVEQGLRLFPLPLETPEEIAHQMEESLFWFACLPEAPLWLAHGLREQGIADEQGNMHRVDLLVDEALYRSDQPHLHLHAIDYKTGNPLAESLTAHKQQVLRYMRLLEQGQDRPVRGTLVYLDQRRLVPVSPSGTDSQLWAMEER